VDMKREIPSFFFPSKYQMAGLPKMRAPTSATEKTRSISITTGMKIDVLVFRTFSRKYIKEAISIM